MNDSSGMGIFGMNKPLRYLIFRTTNVGVYLVLAGVYNIIDEISRSTLLSSETISAFFDKVQIVIGIVMLFRLAVTILQGIVDPEKAADTQAGMGNIVTKVITGLVFLAMLVPLKNMPPDDQLNSYQKNVKYGGILFGTLYEFQDRVLQQHILTKLALGTKGNYTNDELKSMGDTMAAAVLKTFFTPNFKEGVGSDINIYEDKSDHLIKYDHNQLYCNPDDSKAYSKYYEATKPTEVLNMINKTCNGEDHFAFNFNWLTSFIIGILFTVVLIIICIEVAKRAIKLALLRLIAPIPVISYMGSNTDLQNSKLGNWIQMLITTYVDLFITLAIIFFCVSIINEIAIHGLKVGGKQASIFAKVFIYIGLLLFAKDGPKFIKQALGMKDEGGGMLGGLAKGLGAVGAASALGGKKLAAGAYTKARGGSFRDGAGQVQSDNKLLAFKRGLDQNNETLQNKKKAQREIKQMHNDWNKADKWWNEQQEAGKDPANMFDGQTAENYEKFYDNKEFAASAMAVDAADNEYKAAAENYKLKADQHKLTKTDIKRLDDAEKTLQSKKDFHEKMRDSHAKDAKKQDQYKFRKYNSSDPTNVSELPKSSGPSYEIHANDINERYNVHDAPTEQEHAAGQQYYEDVFNNPENAQKLDQDQQAYYEDFFNVNPDVAGQIDANERAADQRQNNNNRN